MLNFTPNRRLEETCDYILGLVVTKIVYMSEIDRESERVARSKLDLPGEAVCLIGTQIPCGNGFGGGARCFVAVWFS
jgi:hypothetical protein